ncbi:hypothetical protein FY036_13485 [Mesorhizobium microcysteis]|uniref:Uncharacterized protein n=1 Tax=Neoaquamicrobium microcysteis TaxID=2682781 RepID=A0A5D4GTA1_9HYPH|nr:hypothetical protein [Mesorhizobium microcysteis]TYR32091.1 hypothetical protein FY036_13485 [Mesorhizobium microcysteis]
MSIEGYHREKFGNAVSCLVSSSDIRTRLLNAFIAMITVNSADFTDTELGARYRDVFERATARPETYKGEGTLQATIGKMTDEEAEKIADEILSIHNELLRKA